MDNIIIIPIICFLVITTSKIFLEIIDVVSDIYIEKLNKKEEEKK